MDPTATIRVCVKTDLPVVILAARDPLLEAGGSFVFVCV